MTATRSKAYLLCLTLTTLLLSNLLQDYKRINHKANHHAK